MGVKNTMSQQILTAIIALLFVGVLAIVFSGVLGLSQEVIDFLKNALIVPGISALLMAFKAFSEISN